MKRSLISAIVSMGCLMSQAQSITIPAVSVLPGGEQTVSVPLAGATDYTAFQFDIALPTGVSITNVSMNGKGDTRQIVSGTTNGKFRVLSYDRENTKLTSETALSMTFKVAETLLPGTIQGSIDNIIVASADGKGTSVTAGTVAITVRQPTEQTVTITSAGQATYCNNFDLDFSEVDGIKAYVASGFNPENGNILQMRVKTVPAGTGLLLKGTPGTYNIPVKSTSFYYLNLFKPVFEATTVPAEEDGKTNYILTDGDDGLMFYKSSGSAKLDANHVYLQIPSSLLGSNNTSNSSNNATEQTVSISSVGQGTYSSYDYDLDFSGVNDIKAYVASGFDPDNGNILLMRVTSVPAGTGILLKGTPGTYNIPVKSTSFYYLNLFKPVFEATTVPAEEDSKTNYILADGDDGLMFYKSSGSATLDSNRAYLQIPTSLLSNNARSLGLTFDDDDTTTAISSMKAESTSNDLYNLNGQRVSTPRRGIYIKNGKKIFIR